jgi:drug/metabolite transporter (DMT)-like permease
MRNEGKRGVRMKTVVIGGIPAALAAALLFGAGTPFAKLLVASVDPWMLAGILYLGSGVGLAIVRFASPGERASIPRKDIPWLAGAIGLGGVVGPVLLMWGLARMPASSASLLLNAEGVFTALIAWFVFRENFDRRIALGMLLIVAGAIVLSWPGSLQIGTFLPSLAVVGACLAWAMDNNLTRKVALADATLIAMLKGLGAGIVNIALALTAGAALPALGHIAAASALGFFSYGLSLVLFVRALRDLGTARTGAYFSTAPFAGAALSVVLLGEHPTWALGIAAGLMGWGVWLHLTEHHVHAHLHAALVHDHEHEHDAHHIHDHEQTIAPGTRHRHMHHHESLAHAHEHFPDAHHRHDHG